MIPKNKDPLQDHPIKNDPSSGSNFLSLNRDRDRLQKISGHCSDFSLAILKIVQRPLKKKNLLQYEQ